MLRRSLQRWLAEPQITADGHSHAALSPSIRRSHSATVRVTRPNETGSDAGDRQV